MGKLKSSETVQKIKGNYESLERGIVNNLHLKIPHGGELGHYREQIWGEMFRNIIPKKFVIEQSVFIIDSFGNVSREVDLAIFDEMYTPYIFRYKGLKFIPIEAVAVVVECKSTSLKKKKLKEWAGSIKELKPSPKSYVRINNEIVVGEQKGILTQSATRPLRILCCMNKGIVNEYLEDGDKLFDIIIRTNSDEGKLSIEIDDSKKNLYDWYYSLNHVGRKEEEIEQVQPQSTPASFGTGGDTKGNAGESRDAWKAAVRDAKLDEYMVQNDGTDLSLLTFNFQLNQLLMLINNPMLFPHKAYAEMFNGKREEGAGE